MQQNLNVPKQLVRRYAATKRRKELLCFAIWLKMKHENSVVFGMDDKQVRYQCRVGKAKAIRLLSDAMEDDELFEFFENGLKVKSFRDKTMKKNKKGRLYQSALCYKFPYRNDYSIRDLFNLINEFLVTDPINAQETDDCCNCRDNNQRGAKAPLTQKALSKLTKMSVSSTRRILKGLEKKGVIKITPSVLFCTLHVIEEDVEELAKRFGRRAVTFYHGSLAYLVIPCSYSIVSRDWSERFRHVIYNYRSKNNDCPFTIPQLCGW